MDEDTLEIYRTNVNLEYYCNEKCKLIKKDNINNENDNNNDNISVKSGDSMAVTMGDDENSVNSDDESFYSVIDNGLNETVGKLLDDIEDQKQEILNIKTKK